MTYEIGQGFRFRPRRRSLLGAIALSGVLLLSACADREQVILPGVREDPRAVLSEADPVSAVENVSAPISLGPAQANPSWTQFFGSPGQRPEHPALSAAPALIWKADIGTGNGRKQRITADPVVAEGRIFTLDAGATVTATSTSGARLWSRDLTPPNDGSEDATGGGIAYADGRLYVTSGFGLLTALDANDGSTLWSQDLEATGSGAPSVRGDLVYLTSGDDTGWAIETGSGRIRWQLDAVTSVSNILGAPPPVLTDDFAIFAFGAGDVQAVFRQGGLRRWDASVVGERRGYASAQIGDITAPPVVDGARIYVGNQSGRTVALALGSGSRIWTVAEGAAGPIWPAGDSVFFVSDQSELLRLSAADGARIWGTDLPRFQNDRPRRRASVFAHYGPIVAGGRVVLASSDGVLRSFDPTNGALAHSADIPGGAATNPVIAGGVLYVINGQGELLAYR